MTYFHTAFSARPSLAVPFGPETLCSRPICLFCCFIFLLSFYHSVTYRIFFSFIIYVSHPYQGVSFRREGIFVYLAQCCISKAKMVHKHNEYLLNVYNDYCSE